jgi:mannose-6-phosphate isomerase-like protein (cupin superfamily)
MYWQDSDSSGQRTVPAYHGGHGVIRTKEFFKGKGALGFTFVIWELAPGASEGDHVHDGEDDYEETYYFLSGEGEMRIAGKSIPIKPGDAFLVQTGVDHGLRNTGGGPLRLVLLFGKPPR